jgi:hypothetical protein
VVVVQRCLRFARCIVWAGSSHVTAESGMKGCGKRVVRCFATSWMASRVDAPSIADQRIDRRHGSHSKESCDLARGPSGDAGKRWHCREEATLCSHRHRAQTLLYIIGAGSNSHSDLAFNLLWEKYEASYHTRPSKREHTAGIDSIVERLWKGCCL